MASLSNRGIIFIVGDLWLIEYGTHIYIIYMSDFYQSWGDSFWCNYFQCYSIANRVIIVTVKRFNIIDVTSYWTISGKHFTLSAWPFYCTISDRMIFGTLNASRYFIINNNFWCGRKTDIWCINQIFTSLINCKYFCSFLITQVRPQKVGVVFFVTYWIILFIIVYLTNFIV